MQSPTLSYALLLNFCRILDAVLWTCTDMFACPKVMLMCNFDVVELMLKNACFELRACPHSAWN